MTTPLNKVLKREFSIRGKLFIATLSPDSLKVTAKGKRKGLELRWEDLVTGDAALAVALNASVGTLTTDVIKDKTSKTLKRRPARPK